MGYCAALFLSTVSLFGRRFFLEFLFLVLFLFFGGGGWGGGKGGRVVRMEV